MKHHKTGFSTPDAIQFVEHGSKQAAKSRTARNKKVLYSYCIVYKILLVVNWAL